MRGSVSAIPWDLIVWTVPGAYVGATWGTHFQGRISERASRTFFSGLFLVIAILFLVAFTVLRHRFA